MVIACMAQSDLRRPRSIDEKERHGGTDATHTFLSWILCVGERVVRHGCTPYHPITPRRAAYHLDRVRRSRRIGKSLPG